MRRLTIIGGDLARSEAAWQAAQQGIEVDLFEMRPNIKTEAHHTTDLAELSCSNSLGSNIMDGAFGLLKEEARIMGALLIKCTEATSIPAGSALPVDREKFSAQVTQFGSNHSCIRIIRAEVAQILESPCIVARGPLTSPKLAEAIQKEKG
jgi:methylenetetrahydrofolate--tRNA-(uracil-5-)-methyltransferase